MDSDLSRSSRGLLKATLRNHAQFLKVLCTKLWKTYIKKDALIVLKVCDSHVLLLELKHAVNAVPTDVYACQVVAETLKANPRARLWAGKSSGICWFIDAFLPRWVFVCYLCSLRALI